MLTFALGKLASEIGKANFYLEILEVIGDILPHETGWIVSYHPSSNPVILHTLDIDVDLVNFYLKENPISSDPYYCSWRESSAARVETLKEALPRAIDKNFYTQNFKKRANFIDEIVLFFPVLTGACISIFLERRAHLFDQAEIACLHQIFPVLLEFHYAHMRALVGNLCIDNLGGSMQEWPQVVLLDHSRKPIFSAQSWQCLSKQSQWSDSGCNAFNSTVKSDQEIDRLSPFRSVSLGSENPLSPGGAILFVDSNVVGEDNHLAAARRIYDMLTPRERDIMLLALEGLCTGTIAQQLKLAKGTVKNYRFRIYRKLNVTSERSLIASVLPFAQQLKNVLSERH